MAHQYFGRSRLTPPKLSDKPETADELCSGLPAEARDVFSPNPECYGAGYDAVHCWTLLGSPCACYNSGLGGGLNGFSHDCKNKPPAAPTLFEEAL